jgi:hypothetical protein
LDSIKVLFKETQQEKGFESYVKNHTTRQKYLFLYFYIGQSRRADRL